MLDQWAPILVFLAVAAAVPCTVVILIALLRSRARVDLPTKYDTYECGEEPEGEAWIRFHPRYYLVSLVFVLFDVEVAFLFPWALNLRGLGKAALIEMFLFLGILLLGWLYALRKGALKWQ